ncbi:MAG: hypothetical protein NT150_03565 [Bacteroidetes bacterium]|nr:hypothetical protein [Bacteroidota bacterium]
MKNLLYNQRYISMLAKEVPIFLSSQQKKVKSVKNAGCFDRLTYLNIFALSKISRSRFFFEELKYWSRSSAG